MDVSPGQSGFRPDRGGCRWTRLDPRQPLAKVEVAGSNPVIRSARSPGLASGVSAGRCRLRPRMLSLVPAADGLLLGVDVGTTETKAVATSLDGRLLAIGSGPTPWEVHDSGGADIAPEALLDSVLTACADGHPKLGMARTSQKARSFPGLSLVRRLRSGSRPR